MNPNGCLCLQTWSVEEIAWPESKEKGIEMRSYSLFDTHSFTARANLFTTDLILHVINSITHILHIFVFDIRKFAKFLEKLFLEKYQTQQHWYTIYKTKKVLFFFLINSCVYILSIFFVSRGRSHSVFHHKTNTNNPIAKLQIGNHR